MPTKSKKPADKQRANSGKRKPPEGRRFRPGESGNPKGRPPGPLCLTANLKRELGRKCPTDKQGRSWLAVICERFLQAAAEGSVSAMRELLDRVEGKVTDKISLEQEPVVRIVYLANEAESVEAWEMEHGNLTEPEKEAYRQRLLDQQHQP